MTGAVPPSIAHRGSRGTISCSPHLSSSRVSGCRRHDPNEDSGRAEPCRPACPLCHRLVVWRRRRGRRRGRIRGRRQGGSRCRPSSAVLADSGRLDSPPCVDRTCVVRQSLPPPGIASSWLGTSRRRWRRRRRRRRQCMGICDIAYRTGCPLTAKSPSADSNGQAVPQAREALISLTWMRGCDEGSERTWGD